MDNADFRKLLASSSASGGGVGEGGDDNGGGGGRGGGGFDGAFKKRKKKTQTEYVAKGAGGRVDRNHLMEAMERDEKIRAQRGGARGRYDDEEDEEEEGRVGGRRNGGGEEGDDEDEEEGEGGYPGRKKGGKVEESGSGGLQASASSSSLPGGVAGAGGMNEDGTYRDRAEERRKGINPDYDDEITRLVHMDAEKTKYLGGDVKHTHLVKGLDYALLQKVRTEMHDEEEGGKDDGDDEDGGKGKKEKGRAEQEGLKEWKRNCLVGVLPRTMLGRGLKAFWVQSLSEEIKPVEMFKMTVLEYRLREDDEEEEEGEEEGRRGLPTIVSRSKVEVEAEQDSPMMLYALPGVLLGKIKRAFESHRQVLAGLKKKGKKRHRAEEEYGHRAAAGRGRERGRKRLVGGEEEEVTMKVEVGDIFGDSVGGKEGGKEGGKVGGVKQQQQQQQPPKASVLRELGWDKEEDGEPGGEGNGGRAVDMAAILKDAGVEENGGKGDRKGGEEELQPELFARTKAGVKKRREERREGGLAMQMGGGYEEYLPSATFDVDSDEEGGKEGGREGEGVGVGGEGGRGGNECQATKNKRVEKDIYKRDI
ncbi:Hypothetical protein NocV09_02500710 [Nannochloropsis oceanica]